MARSISVNKKKKRRGRPVTTGIGTLIGVRFQAATLTKLDRWADGQDENISRPEAIRRLVESALEGGDHGAR